MPLETIIDSEYQTKVFVWRITETEDELSHDMILSVNSLSRLQNMKSDSHRKGFLAVRKILEHLGYNDFDLVYDETGKPKFSSGQHISISHSFDFSVVVLSDVLVGVDIEKSRDKVTKLAHRFCSEHFYLENYSLQQINDFYTIVWGTKEVVFKIENKEGISFKDHIFAKPFDLNSSEILVNLDFYEQPKYYKMTFHIVDNYAIVWGWKK